MRRKLISYEAFNRLEKDSLSNAEHELSEAESVLSNLLETGPLSLHCFDKANVVYEMGDGTYVRANYKLVDNKISFENIEHIVIDEDSFTKTSKGLIRDMLEALANDDEAKANTSFDKYMEIASPKMKYMKGRRSKTAGEKMVSNMKYMGEGTDEDKDDKGGFPFFKKGKKGKFGKDKSAASDKAEREVERAKDMGGKMKCKDKDMKEWRNVASNVLSYISFTNIVPGIQESKLVKNDLGDVSAVVVPNAQSRNEGKILAYKYKGLKSDVKVLREHGLQLANNAEFQRAVADVKKYNNFSDNDGLEESIGNLVGQFPSVLYLTQEELAKTISAALENAGEHNFDDQRCNFMAEGILRVAFEAYPERAHRVVSLANATLPESEDAYVAFQDVVRSFYPAVDEQMAVEMRVFEDLRNVFVEVRRAALENDHDIIRTDASRYIEKLESVLDGSAHPDVTLAEQAAAYIRYLVETNLESQTWVISKQPYTTLTGEHPDMAKKAAYSYAPSKDFSGDWGDPAPALDDEGGSYKSGGAKKMRNNSWGNIGGKDVYPSLQNPNIPKSGDWTIKGEKGVDKSTDDAFGQYQSGDTVPVLSNPYVPKSVKLHVNSDNRVDDVEAKL